MTGEGCRWDRATGGWRRMRARGCEPVGVGGAGMAWPGAVGRGSRGNGVVGVICGPGVLSS